MHSPFLLYLLSSEIEIIHKSEGGGPSPANQTGGRLHPSSTSPTSPLPDGGGQFATAQLEDDALRNAWGHEQVHEGLSRDSPRGNQPSCPCPLDYPCPRTEWEKTGSDRGADLTAGPDSETALYFYPMRGRTYVDFCFTFDPT
ncbi:unnamed protein product [Boreogadus saida]